MNTEITIIEPSSALKVFTSPGELDPILEKIAQEAKSIVPDVSTAKGRKEIASIAYRVAQSKTYIDGLGKSLVDEYKELPRKIDASRKAARDFLDALKEEVRAPLTEWEAEQERIEAEKKAAEEAEKLRIQIEHDYELAVLMNAEFDRQREEQRRIAEQERIERERLVAEEAARREREASEQRVIEERLRAERAEQARKEAEERAERAAAEAVEAERRRAEEEAERARKEQAKRQEDLEHRKQINRAALTALVEFGLSDEMAKLAISAIATGKVPNIQINY